MLFFDRLVGDKSDRYLDILFKDLNLNLSRRNNRNLFEFQNCLKEELVDGRGGKRRACFYDEFPDMEQEAINHLMETSTNEDCSFTMYAFAEFFNDRFYQIYSYEDTGDGHVRSVASLRTDMKNLGFTFDETGKKKPYWQGHEREDVVEARQSFINYFLSRKENYYRPDLGQNLSWISPTEKTCVLLFHDESTFRSGEQSRYQLSTKIF